jgi:hypothetical protein
MVSSLLERLVLQAVGLGVLQAALEQARPALAGQHHWFNCSN